MLLRSVPGSLAIVVPVGPGDRAWKTLFPTLQGQAVARAVMVFAVGDHQRRPLPTPRVSVITAPAGRAHQLNVGWQACDAEWVWFLHADSGIDDAGIEAATRFIAGNRDAIGYFDLAFAPDGPALMWLNALGARIRSDLLRLPFGDQGLLIERRLLQRLGGFDTALSSGEDHAFVWRARADGITLRRTGASLRTSARKYAEHGWAAITAHHLRLTWLQARRFKREARST
jgi:glycosyltransferase involved in cell wall biosynthesis